MSNTRDPSSEVPSECAQDKGTWPESWLSFFLLCYFNQRAWLLWIIFISYEKWTCWTRLSQYLLNFIHYHILTLTNWIFRRKITWNTCHQYKEDIHLHLTSFLFLFYYLLLLWNRPFESHHAVLRAFFWMWAEASLNDRIGWAILVSGN